MSEVRKVLTGKDYQEIASCLRRALAVFSRTSRVLSEPEQKVRTMLMALLAELESSTPVDGKPEP